MKMKVLLLGANGMLGKSLHKVLSYITNMDIVTVARNNADYTLDLLDDAKLKDCFESVKPDICINSAAIVNLSLCEENHKLAYDTNARLCSSLTDLSKNCNTYYIQISTDHYYAGDGRKKHDENYPVIFCNEYARTKYAGEKFAELYNKSLILRTNIVGFKGNDESKTFLEWAIESIISNSEMTLFNDFFTSSISTDLFAKVLMDAIRHRLTGVYNLASSTVASKEEFIVELSKKLFNRLPLYNQGSVNLLGGAKRANSLGLDVKRIENALGYSMPDLEQVLYSIRKEYQGMN